MAVEGEQNRQVRGCFSTTPRKQSEPKNKMSLDISQAPLQCHTSSNKAPHPKGSPKPPQPSLKGATNKDHAFKYMGLWRTVLIQNTTFKVIPLKLLSQS